MIPSCYSIKYSRNPRLEVSNNNPFRSNQNAQVNKRKTANFKIENCTSIFEHLIKQIREKNSEFWHCWDLGELTKSRLLNKVYNYGLLF